MAFKNILWEGKRVNKLKELFGFAYIISANIHFLNMAFKNILWEGKRVNKLKELFVHQVICYKCLFLFGCGLFGCLLWTLLCDLLCCGFFGCGLLGSLGFLGSLLWGLFGSGLLGLLWGLFGSSLLDLLDGLLLGLGCLLGLLGLSGLLDSLETTRCTGSLGLGDFLALDQFLNGLPDEGGNLDDVNLVVGSDVFFNGGQR